MTKQLLPPHKDCSLENRTGEYWKDIPSLEGYFLISSEGRIKRIRRTEINKVGIPLSFDTKIILPGVCSNKRLSRTGPVQHLQTAFTCHGKMYRYQISRLVYYLFVAPFDMNNSNILVTPKNGNTLDVRPQNLRLEEKGAMYKKAFKNGTRKHWSALTPAGTRTEEYQQFLDRMKVQVSMYDLNGRWVQTFASIRAAAASVGINGCGIIRAIKMPHRKAAGHYWRKGDANMLNFKDLSRALREQDKKWIKEVGTPIRQYKPDGTLVREYPAITRACKATGISSGAIWQNIRGTTRHAGGFIWKI